MAGHSSTASVRKLSKRFDRPFEACKRSDDFDYDEGRLDVSFQTKRACSCRLAL